MPWPNQDVPCKVIELTPSGSVVDPQAEWPEVETPCEQAPAGQCEYSIFDPDVCIWCGERTP
jgi:hypothetical protein